MTPLQGYRSAWSFWVAIDGRSTQQPLTMGRPDFLTQSNRRAHELRPSRDRLLLPHIAACSGAAAWLPLMPFPPLERTGPGVLRLELARRRRRPYRSNCAGHRRYLPDTALPSRSRSSRHLRHLGSQALLSWSRHRGGAERVCRHRPMARLRHPSGTIEKRCS